MGLYSTTSKAKKKLANKSIDLLNVTYDELIASMPNECLNHAQHMPNSCLIHMPKENSYSQVKQGLQGYSGTGGFDHGLRLQGSAVNDSIIDNLSLSTPTHTDDWLEEYDKADGQSPT